MSYADLNYYRNTYKGRACASDSILQGWLDRATDDINILNNYNININDLSITNLDLLKKSNCAQAEHYVINGDGYDDFNNFTIGKFSVSNKEYSSRQTTGLCERAEQFLTAANLNFRGIQCARYL